jgi:hypothetical protein
MNRVKPIYTAISTWWQAKRTRGNAAHVLMILFVSFNTTGAWIIAPQYGLITAGVCSGIYGFLLGRE